MINAGSVGTRTSWVGLPVLSPRNLFKLGKRDVDCNRIIPCLAVNARTALNDKGSVDYSENNSVDSERVSRRLPLFHFVIAVGNPTQFRMRSVAELRRDARAIFDAALEAVEPAHLVERHFHRVGNTSRLRSAATIYRTTATFMCWAPERRRRRWAARSKIF